MAILLHLVARLSTITNLIQEHQQKTQLSTAHSLTAINQKAQANKSSGGSSGGSGGSGGSIKKTSSGSSGGSGGINKSSSSKAGAPTKDASKYGTFSNGYQPKGIGGYGYVSKTGNKVVVNGKTQNLWKTDDGTLWYWDGSVRAYKKTSLPSVKGGAMAGGIMSRYIK